MESDIGNPLEYTPDVLEKEEQMEDEQHEQEPMYYYPPPPPPPPPQQMQYQEKIDIFSNLDKTAYIVVFVAFILGFFMGKTMQPVILRPG
tara:strand:- start:3916 stop:4185 length:270 start_codon:yes stop_codon:yes gene_type:complete